MRLRKTKAERLPQLAVVKGAGASRGRRLKGHLFSTILASAGFHGLWQSHLHSSLMQEGCLLFLHDQLMPDP
jgi:hypothetical protein